MAKYNPSPRTRGTKLLEPKSEQPKVESPMTTRKFDVEHYELTNEIKYLDEEGTTVQTINLIKNAKKMREEITTIDQFRAIGTRRDIANKYGVELPAVHGLYLSLTAKAKREAKEEEKMIQGPSMEEVEQFFADTEVSQGFPETEVSQVEMNPSETNQAENVFCADCGGLFVPKDRDTICQSCAEVLYQIDYPEQYEVLEESVNELEEQWDGPSKDDLMQSSIRMSWDEIRAYLAIIRKKEIELVDRRIKAKFEEMLGVTA